jgi:hypothetical protein
VFWRPGFRIDSRTTKRGSRVSNLVVSFRELKPLHTWHHLFWFLFGFSLCQVLYIVVIFTVIPSSSKMDFVWKPYCIFGVGGFTDLCLKRGQTFLHLFLSSFVGLWCFYAWFSRAHCGESNEPKIIKNRVQILKLLLFFVAISSRPDYPPKTGPDNPRPSKFG